MDNECKTDSINTPRIRTVPNKSTVFLGSSTNSTHSLHHLFNHVTSWHKLCVYYVHWCYNNKPNSARTCLPLWEIQTSCINKFIWVTWLVITSWMTTMYQVLEKALTGDLPLLWPYSLAFFGGSTAADIHNSESQKQLNCPSIGEWINAM